MIVWIFFLPGSGGDGLANLLEQASNVVSLDNNKQWRIHRYVDSKVKFWAPTLENSLKRINTVDQLNDWQRNIAESDDQYLVITSHDLELKTTFLKNTLSEKKHIKILLKPKDITELLVNAKIKNLIEFNRLTKNIKNNDYIVTSNFNIFLESIPDHWADIKNLADFLGLELTKEHFMHYKKIVTGELMYDTSGIEYYKSFIDVDNVTKYKKIN